jgi:hypothetical protein
VIRLGLRLTLQGGREVVVRLVLVVAAVALGTGLLLAAVSGTNAIHNLNSATEWLWTGRDGAPAVPPKPGIAPLWWHVSRDTFRGQMIARVDVAATGSSSPVPPGIGHDPGPGQYYASPALASLLRSTPADELAARYPGHLIGTIGDTALQGPNSLVIIVGHAAAQLARTPDTVRVTAIATPMPGNSLPRIQHGLSGPPPIQGLQGSGVDFILSVVALAMLTPVLIFIGTATRLSAARREQRFAAMRLVGATRRQVALIATVESTAATIGGVALGFGLFYLLRIPLAGIPFTGQPFFPAQMSLSIPDMFAAAIGIPVAAAVVARLALRRVQISPLGVTRRTTPKPPTAWRLVPLLAGVAELGYFVLEGRPSTISAQIQAYFPGMLLIVIGLIIAGPWLTMAGARFMARRARHPGALIASRRLADDPRAAFRAVSGLVLALFVTTVAVSLMSTDNTKLIQPYAGSQTANVLNDQLVSREDGSPNLPAPPAAALARVRAVSGVTSVLEVHTDTTLTIPGFGNAAGLVSCAQLAKIHGLGHCAAGATVAGFPVPLGQYPLKSLVNATWPAEPVPAHGLNSVGLAAVDVATNGSRQAVEGARTILDNATPYPAQAPQTLGEWVGNANSLNSAYQQLTDVVILTSLAIAGCTLAASIAGSLADRKRPFSMLRLTGARLATLRRVVVLESAVPLLAVAIVAVGVGFGAAALYASSEMGHSLVPPGAGYYLITAAGVIASLAIIAATFPLLRRITGPEVARNE